jgi:hypothetical protein
MRAKATPISGSNYSTARTWGRAGTWTGGKIGDYVIHVVYKMRDENGNSGVFIRIPLEPRRTRATTARDFQQ